MRGSIDNFLLHAGNAASFKGNANVDEAVKKLKLPNLFTPLPGMEVALMPHQAIGVAWMAEAEASVNKGGLLGDDMGLGKTVQMISMMMHNRSKDPVCKTSLILAPTALLDQWKLEIELKTNDSLSCVIYHGKSYLHRSGSFIVIANGFLKAAASPNPGKSFLSMTW